MQSFNTKIHALNDGAYDVSYENKRYLLRKETLLEGKLIKLYAEELGGNNFISLNYYPHIKNGLLKPCEMPEEKVKAFVLGLSTL
jgi:hypothetical protein